ncbi:MAG: hypothetical protein AAF708_02480, partial [Deinococcota bacterium]
MPADDPLDYNAPTSSSHPSIAATGQTPDLVLQNPILTALWDSPDLGLVLVTLEGEIQAANPAFCTQTGQLVEALVRKAYRSVLQMPQQQVQQVTAPPANNDLDALNDTLVNTAALFEDDLDGQDLTADDEDIADSQHNAHRSFATDQHQHFKGNLRHQTGTLHEVQVTVMPLGVHHGHASQTSQAEDMRVLLVRPVAQATSEMPPPRNVFTSIDGARSTPSVPTPTAMTSSLAALNGPQLKHLLQLVETISDFICLMDSEGVVRYVNPAGLE